MLTSYMAKVISLNVGLPRTVNFRGQAVTTGIFKEPVRGRIKGMFGENLTTEGLLEDQVNIGDIFRIGSSEVVATQPRMPCYKLGVKFGRMDIVRQFMESKLTGIYFRVLKEGDVGAGDEIELISRDENNVTVKDIVQLVSSEGDMATIRRAVHIKALPEAWRQEFLDHLGRQDGID
jgi:MOSC domain-containing protein YiiM